MTIIRVEFNGISLVISYLLHFFRRIYAGKYSEAPPPLSDPRMLGFDPYNDCQATDSELQGSGRTLLFDSTDYLEVTIELFFYLFIVENRQNVWIGMNGCSLIRTLLC
jgi:hypothetical protein